jgi:hypothetical protein
MTPREKNIRICRALGWVRQQGSWNRSNNGNPDFGILPKKEIWTTWWELQGRCLLTEHLPDHFNDLNIISEAEKKIPGRLFSSWSQHLVNVLIEQSPGPEGVDITDVSSPVEMCGHAAQTTASQRAEAFGRTLNLW